MNKIKNVSSSKILINLPNVRFRTELQPKQERPLQDDVFYEFLYDPGCINMVKWGFLGVIYDETAADKIDGVAQPVHQHGTAGLRQG